MKEKKLIAKIYTSVAEEFKDAGIPMPETNEERGVTEDRKMKKEVRDFLLWLGNRKHEFKQLHRAGDGKERDVYLGSLKAIEETIDEFLTVFDLRK